MQNRNKKLLRIFVIGGVILTIGFLWVIKISTGQSKIVPATPTVVETKTKTEKSSGTEAEKTTSAFVDGGLHVTDVQELKSLQTAGLPVMIDFGADSCIPCKEMAPVLAALHEELKGKAIIRFVDVWKYSHLAEGYPISVIPTQVFFDAQGQPFKPNDTFSVQMTRYNRRDTNVHVFTTHEGGLSREQILLALTAMGMKK